MSKEKFYFSKSLEKGMNILALFDGESKVLTQSQIARKLGLNPTSTYRYINTLVELGYLDKDAKTKRIRPSVRCLLFCNNLIRATDHMRLVKEIVDEVNREHNITIDVAFAVDYDLVRLYNRQAEETLTYSLPDYARNCLHNTALGKAFLASLPEAGLEEKMAGLDFNSRTEKTILDKKGLLKELKETRAREFSINREEYLPGLISIAAPLLDPDGKTGLGAVSFDFSVWEHDLKEIKLKYGPLIIETARRLSAILPPAD